MNALRYFLRGYTLLLVVLPFGSLTLPAAAQTTYLRTTNGNWTDDAGWSPSGVPGPSDTADLGGRTVTLDTDATVAVLIFPPVIHSVLAGASALAVTDTLRWEAGQSNMTGTLTVGSAATFRVRGTAILRMGTGGVLVNRGRMVWESPRSWGDVGRLINEGEIEIPLEAADPIQLCFSNENPAITNAAGGLVRRTGPGTVQFSCGFNNDGTVRVEQGAFEQRGFNGNGGTDTGAYEVEAGATLRFGGGNRTLTAAASITGAGTVEAQTTGNIHSVSHAGGYDVATTRLLGPSSPRFNLNVDVTLPVLEMTSGFLGGSGTITVTDALTWTDGDMDGGGTTVIQPDFDLNVANVGLGDTRTLYLEGTTTWSGEVDISNGTTEVTVVNAGTVLSTGPGERFLFAGVFRNEGLLVHDDGLLRFISGFDNLGEVHVDGGTLALQGFNATGGTDTGAYTVAGGAHLEFSGGNRTLTETAEVAGSGTVVATGPLTNGASWKPGASPGGLTIASTYPAGSGVLEMEVGGYTPGTEYDQLAVTGTATLGGTLRVLLINGFVPTEDDRFLIIPAGGAVTGAFATLDLPTGLDAFVETTIEGVELVIGKVTVAIEPEAGLPEVFALHAAYPNPFNPQAIVPFDVAEAGRIRLAVYDLLGREVAVLVDGERPAGRHEAVLNGAGLASGIYLVRMAAEGFTQTRRVTLLR